MRSRNHTCTGKGKQRISNSICKTTFRYDRTHSTYAMNTTSPPSPPFKTSTSFKPLNCHPKKLSRTTVVLYGVFGSMSAGLEVCSGEDTVSLCLELVSRGLWQNGMPWCTTISHFIKSAGEPNIMNWSQQIYVGRGKETYMHGF